MKTNRFYIAYSIAFIALLLAPMLFIDPYGGDVSETENRVLASRPPMSEIFCDTEGFVRKFDDWISDNIGFRYNYISFYKSIDSLGNNIQYTDGSYVYLIGEEGHHYFAHTNGWMISKFQGEAILSDEKLQDLAAGLNAAKEYLDNRGIPFVLMLCTDKESVYPEYYPKSIKQGTEPIQLDIVTDYIKNNTNVDVLNIRQTLLDKKDDYLLYAKAEGDLTHFNDVAAFFSYRDLMNRISAYIPGLEPLNLNDVDIVYDEDFISTTSLKETPSFSILEPDFFDAVELQRPFQWENYVTENINHDLPVILLMRDSYAGSEFLGKYLPEHFSKAIFIHYSNMENFEQYVTVYSPDIVVFESAERELGGFTSYISKLHAIANDSLQP